MRQGLIFKSVRTTIGFLERNSHSLWPPEDDEILACNVTVYEYKTLNQLTGAGRCGAPLRHNSTAATMRWKTSADMMSRRRGARKHVARSPCSGDGGVMAHADATLPRSRTASDGSNV